MIQSGRFTKPLLVLLTLAILPSSTLVSAEQLRFQAMLFNGTIVDGKTLQNWYDDKTPPVLDKTQIFNKANPIRWLMDREKELPQTPKAYVEFVGGDRLPGKIIGHRSGSEDPFHWRESHLLVEPSIDLTFPGRQWDVPLRVGTRWLKRVVGRVVAVPRSHRRQYCLRMVVNSSSARCVGGKKVLRCCWKTAFNSFLLQPSPKFTFPHAMLGRVITSKLPC